MENETKLIDSAKGTKKKYRKSLTAVLTGLIALSLLSGTACSVGTGSGGAKSTAPAQDELTETPAKEPEPTAVRTLAPGQYFADNGVIYVPQGYTSAEKDTFTFKKDFSATILEYTDKDFNRISIKYSSTKPLKAKITYKVGGEPVEDTFYLEAGENVTFNGLILGYLNGDSANSIETISLDSLKATADFRLSELDTSKEEVYNDNSFYLQNDRFKVGVRLNWGGGINYVEDLSCPVNGLTNLINSHDTGRLVQQSYYGGYDSTYTPGEFNGSTWTYNPVQGGDKYGNSSRLIDLEIGSNYVYIKSQPQDWAQNNLITPSYMENKYTVEADYIRVDNRFVDFSGYPHGFSNQELPAFYTVSYLNCFTWYNGVNSWADEKLTHRAELQFWGDSRYAGDCRFIMKEGNTETWCAWTNPKDDFGIGLYVPNIDLFYAGRFEYNGSKKANNNATNYVAPLLTIKLPNYTALEYSYLITTGTLDGIRATFKANKDFAANESLHRSYSAERGVYVDYTDIDFTDKKNTYVLAEGNNAAVTYNSSSKAVKLRVKGADPQTFLDFGDFTPGVTADNYSTLSIEYMVPVSNSRDSYSCDLFICTGDKFAPDGSEMVRSELICDGEYHTLEIALSALDFWKGELNLIRFDFFDECASGDTLMLRSFRLS